MSAYTYMPRHMNVCVVRYVVSVVGAGGDGIFVVGGRDGDEEDLGCNVRTDDRPEDTLVEVTGCCNCSTLPAFSPSC